jgi:L-amino acid N-acyltransferase YncA
MKSEILIRPAVPDDAEAVAALYAPYVQKTAITFETAVPDDAEFSRRIADTLTRYPFLTAYRADGTLAGYAYAASLSPRPAYDWSAETTVYLDPRFWGEGLGRRLYQQLFDLLAAQHVVRAFACITADNAGSVAFHRSLGFADAGRFADSGFKNGRWYDVLWMEKALGPLAEKPEPLIPFSALPAVRPDCFAAFSHAGDQQ